MKRSYRLELETPGPKDMNDNTCCTIVCTGCGLSVLDTEDAQAEDFTATDLDAIPCACEDHA